MIKLSAFIITLNERDNIARCIHSLIDIVDEVIVLDSQSIDGTREIAAELGANVFEHKYLGDGPQKNHAADLCQHDWILSIDADEALSEEARRFISARAFRDGFAYAFRRKNFIANRWVKYGDAYPDYVIRLYQRSQSRYSEKFEHAKVETRNLEKRGENILHYNVSSISGLYEKSVKFAKRSAKGMYRNQRDPGFPLASGAWSFFRLYILKRGFLGGPDCFHHCLAAAMRSFLKHALLAEYLRDPDAAPKPNGSDIW